MGILGAALGPIASVVSSGINAIATNKANKATLRAQREENEKNRSFNHAEAKLAYDRSVAQWNRENQSNSPSSMMARLREAGLNPNLAYGEISSAVGSAGSYPAASSSGAVSPQLPSLIDTASVANSFAQAGLLQAQTRKINAEADVTSSYAKFADAINAGLVENQNVQISLGQTAADLNDAQKKKLFQEIKKIDSEMEVLKSTKSKLDAEGASLSEDVKYKKLQNYFASDMFQAQVRSLRASAHLSETQASDLLKTQFLRMLCLSADSQSSFADAALKYAEKNKVDIESDNASLIGDGIHLQNMKLEADATDARNYKNFVRDVPFVGSFLSSLNHVFSSVLSFSAN